MRVLMAMAGGGNLRELAGMAAAWREFAGMMAGSSGSSGKFRELAA